MIRNEIIKMALNNLVASFNDTCLQRFLLKKKKFTYFKFVQHSMAVQDGYLNLRRNAAVLPSKYLMRSL